jgi:hypothetical protein
MRLEKTEFYNFYSSTNIIRMIKSRKMKWVGHVPPMAEMRNAYISVTKPQGQKPLGNPRYRWEDNITMDLKEIGHKV